MGRHVAADLPDLDRLVEDACAAIGRDIEALKVPRLMGVVLGGGYGRGEGGAREKQEGTALSNDLDFFAVADEGAPEAATISAVGAALEPVAKKWTEKLGVDVDFAVKTRWRLKHDEERIMVQELLRGHFDVAGEKGERLFAGIELRPAESIPWMEAARLMMNRGMGLLFAKREIESAECEIDGSPAVGRRPSGEQRDFVSRNINKCVLGAGDARLITRRAYAWRAEDRAKALGDGLYNAATGWKFRPTDEPVCSWEKARETWLAALDEVLGDSSGPSRSRTMRNVARWFVRRRTVGELRTVGLDPVVRILRAVSRLVRERRGPGASLLRDWEVFN